jgi:hypothetical protein
MEKEWECHMEKEWESQMAQNWVELLFQERMEKYWMEIFGKALKFLWKSENTGCERRFTRIFLI